MKSCNICSHGHPFYYCELAENHDGAHKALINSTLSAPLVWEGGKRVAEKLEEPEYAEYQRKVGL